MHWHYQSQQKVTWDSHEQIRYIQIRHSSSLYNLSARFALRWAQDFRVPQTAVLHFVGFFFQYYMVIQYYQYAPVGTSMIMFHLELGTLPNLCKSYRSSLGLRVCQGNRWVFHGSVFLAGTFCTVLSLPPRGVQLVPWSRRIDSPCHSILPRATAVILVKHTPLSLDSPGGQLVM